MIGPVNKIGSVLFCQPFCQPRRFRFGWTVSTILLAVGTFISTSHSLSPIVGQEPSPVPIPSPSSDQKPEPSSDLPHHAVWRIGEAVTNDASGGYYHLAFSRDGRWLATRNRDNVIAIYDVPSRRQLCEVRGHDARIIRIDFSPDGRHFLTSAPGVNEHTKVWETQTGKLAETLDVNAMDARFSRDGTQIVCLDEKNVYRFSWPDGKLLGSQTWVNGAETPLTISREGKLVVSYREVKDQVFQIQVHDLVDRSVILLDGPTFRPRSAVLSENGKFLAANYFRQSRVAMWDLADPHELKSKLDGHDATVQSLAFSDDSRFLLTTSWDMTAVVWDVLSKEPIQRLKGHRAYVTSVAAAMVPALIVTGASGRHDSSALVWNFRDILFPNPPRLVGPDGWDQLWQELGATAPREALNAVNDLVHALNQSDMATPLLVKGLGLDRDAISPDSIRRQIRLLGSPHYDQRRSATRWLLNNRREADGLLRETLQSTVDPEIRYRATRIMQTPISRPKIDPIELRRLHRIIMALEFNGSDDARNLLNSLAERHPHIDIARDARSSLERIDMRRQQPSAEPGQ